MKKEIFIFLIMMFYISNSYCQDLYVLKQNDKIYKLTSSNGVFKLEHQVTVQGNTSNLADIAISSDNKLYATSAFDGIRASL